GIPDCCGECPAEARRHRSEFCQLMGNMSMKTKPMAVALLACLFGTAGAQAQPARPGAELACYAPWDSGTIYEGDAQVSEAGRNFVAKHRTQGNRPSENVGDEASGQPWSGGYACGAPMVERAPIPDKYKRMARSMMPATSEPPPASLPSDFIETQIAH